MLEKMRRKSVMSFLPNISLAFNCNMRTNIFRDIFIFSLVVFFLFPCCASSSLNRTDLQKEFRIGLLLPADPVPPGNIPALENINPRYPFFYQMVRPAIDIAIIAVKERILPNHEVGLVYNNTNCNLDITQILAVDHNYMYLADVFLGPVCEFAAAPVSRFVAHWKVPFLSAGARAVGFDVNPILTNMIGSYYKMGIVVERFMEMYKWNNTMFLIHDEPGNIQDYSFACGGPFNVLHEHRYNVSYVTFNGYRTTTDYSELLDQVRPKARVVVMCASSDTVRKIMLEAHKLEMTKGDYAFFNIIPFDSQYFGFQGEKMWYREGDSQNQQAKEAYRALMSIRLHTTRNEEDYQKFAAKVKEKALVDHQYSYEERNESVNSFVAAFHDAVILYAIALNESLADPDSDPRNGTDLTRRMWNRTFEGITGNVTIDENGDRDSDYALFEMTDIEEGTYEVVGVFSAAYKNFTLIDHKTIDWPGSEPPVDVPVCGFKNENCLETDGNLAMNIAMGAMAMILLLFVLIILYVYRKYKYEKELSNMSWKVKWDDITFNSKIARRLGGSRMSLGSAAGGTSNDSGQSVIGHNQQIFTVTGYYKGLVVAIKRVNRERVELTRQILMELKAMRDIQHDHATKFIGACVDPPNISILTEYCPKGSLQDILENDSIDLDDMFKYSLMYDMVKGMHYLHSSVIHSHGNLKSSNCVVDSRFVLKITDYGLNSVREPDHSFEKDEEDSFKYYQRRLWTAPELLRLPEIPSGGTQKADVYSFGIILQEIIYREGVFYIQGIEIPPEEIVTKLKQGNKPHFRPTVERALCPEEVIPVINKCWSEDPAERPDFSQLRGLVRKLNKGRESLSLVDNLLSRMEQYASNLEVLVEERTEAFYEEKRKAEELLYQILPKPVAEELKKGKPVTAETFESVSIYFSDIVGFTKLSSQSTPLQVVDLLNDLYTCFDAIIDNFNVYKVETIGDAYMVVSGLPVRNGDYHAREIARMSLSLLQGIKTFKIRHRPEENLKLRIGLHSGSCVAGVVGLKMPRYCLFGDTVNTASRMESNGEAMKIHVSSCTKKILDLFGTFVLEKRGEVEMKGKGIQTTYWLKGELKDQNGICDFKYQEITV